MASLTRLVIGLAVLASGGGGGGGGGFVLVLSHQKGERKKSG